MEKIACREVSKESVKTGYLDFFLKRSNDCFKTSLIFSPFQWLKQSSNHVLLWLKLELYQSFSKKQKFQLCILLNCGWSDSAELRNFSWIGIALDLLYFYIGYLSIQNIEEGLYTSDWSLIYRLQNKGKNVRLVGMFWV